MAADTIPPPKHGPGLAALYDLLAKKEIEMDEADEARERAKKGVAS